MQYETYADIPAAITDRLPATDRNTDSEKALILRAVNATIDARTADLVGQRIRATTEAMEEWTGAMVNAQQRHRDYIGMLQRIARATEKFAGITENL